MELKDKVAVITGAASGIGRGLAEKAGQLGMAAVLADRDAEKLRALEVALTAQGRTVLAVPTDVADYGSVVRLADTAFERFGTVNFLFNNAGVLVDGLSWERSVEDWRWSFDVNVMGVVHGIKAFVPRMIASGEEGWVVNTASMAGLIAGPYLGPYTATKHAIVGISETLHYELAVTGSKIRAAVLCPGEVATEIWNSERIRPPEYGHKPGFSRTDETQFREQVSLGVAQGIKPIELATFVFDELAAGKFWLLSHKYVKDLYRRRADTILSETVPAFSMGA